MIRFSIIIPHKDTPKLLERCLASIPRRPDVEIIVIDDASSPKERELLTSVQKQNPSVEFILTDEGRGAGYARNVGLSQAQGKWLVFADADDYFTPYINEVFDLYAHDTTTDILFLNTLNVDENGKESIGEQGRLIERQLTGKPYGLDLLKYRVWTPWSRMFRRTLVTAHNIRFEEEPVGNDAMFVLNATSFAKTFSVVPKVCYYYYQPSTGSLTYRRYTDETFIRRLRLKLQINSLYRKVSFPFPWPIISKIDNGRLSPQCKKKVGNLLQEYEHTRLSELNARCRQLLLKLLF